VVENFKAWKMNFALMIV